MGEPLKSELCMATLRAAWIALYPAVFVKSGETEKRCFAVFSCRSAARDPGSLISHRR